MSNPSISGCSTFSIESSANKNEIVDMVRDLLVPHSQIERLAAFDHVKNGNRVLGHHP